MNNASATRTAFANLLIDPQPLAEVTGTPVTGIKIPQRCATRRDRIAQYLLDRQRQALITRGRNASRRTRRMDAGKEQRLIRVDITDPDDDVTVHEKLLDRDTPLP
jgi:hypothetical protein